MDLVDKLITDLCLVTESLMDIESQIDLAAWQPFPKKEKATDSNDAKAAADANSKKNEKMKGGIHKSVC